MDLNQLLDCLKPLHPALQLPVLEQMSPIPSFLGVQAGQSLNHLTVCAKQIHHFTPSEKQPAKSEITNALTSIGNSISEEKTLFQTRAGWLNANPAVLFVSLTSDTDACEIIAVCFAKEGLINQKTAEKAIKRFEIALKNQDFNFQSKIVLPLTRLTDQTIPA